VKARQESILFRLSADEVELIRCYRMCSEQYQDCIHHFIVVAHRTLEASAPAERHPAPKT
jgi:hypothetical protein